MSNEHESQTSDAAGLTAAESPVKSPADVPVLSGFGVGSRLFIVCSICGNKRCPHAADSRNACTGSNEPGQAGSNYE